MFVAQQLSLEEVERKQASPENAMTLRSQTGKQEKSSQVKLRKKKKIQEDFQKSHRDRSVCSTHEQVVNNNSDSNSKCAKSKETVSQHRLHKINSVLGRD